MQKSSSCGARCVLVASFGHTSLSTKRKVCKRNLVQPVKSPYHLLGLSLEQVDQMLEETTALKSSQWVPTTTFVDRLDKHEKEELEIQVVRRESVPPDTDNV